MNSLFHLITSLKSFTTTFCLQPCIHYYSNEVDWLFGFDLSKDNLDAKTNYGDSKYERKTLGFMLDRITAIRAMESERELQGGEGGLFSLFDNQLNEVNKDEWAGGVGLIRDFGEENRAYVTIGFYRYPATDEYMDFGTPAINQNLEPENGYEVELGTDWSIDRILQKRIIRQWMQDEIIYDPLIGLFGSKYKRKITNGLDFSIDWEITDYFQINS